MTFINLDEYFRYKSCSLSKPGYHGFDFKFLESLADFETKLFIKDKSLFSTAFGCPILLSELKKLFSYTDNFFSISRHNIQNLIGILKHHLRLEKINIPTNLQSKNQICEYISNFIKLNTSTDILNPTIYYVEDVWGLNYENLNFNNLIFISSIYNLLGIKGINLGWLISSNKLVQDHILDIINHNDENSCIFSEIYAIISLRNFHLLNKINQEILAHNKNIIEKSVISKKFIISDIYPNAILKIENAKDIQDKYFRNFGTLLNITNHDEINLYFGQKNFPLDYNNLLEIILKNI